MISFELSKTDCKIIIDNITLQMDICPDTTISSSKNICVFSNIQQGVDLEVDTNIGIVMNLIYREKSTYLPISIVSKDPILVYQADGIIISSYEAGKIMSFKQISGMMEYRDGKIIIGAENETGITCSIEIIEKPKMSVPVVMSVPTPSSRPIYKTSPGPVRFDVYFFQGLYEGTIDYPFNIYNGIPITGTVPLSPAIDPTNQDLVNAYLNSKGLSSFTIYIEFVCNTIIATTNLAPLFLYDVIPPVPTALATYDNVAEFVGNINGVSVYRGTYTVHKQSEPLDVDGIYTIQFRVNDRATSDLIFLIPRVYGHFLAESSSIGGPDTLAM